MAKSLVFSREKNIDVKLIDLVIIAIILFQINYEEYLLKFESIEIKEKLTSFHSPLQTHKHCSRGAPQPRIRENQSSTHGPNARR